jgi:hypothetical protein
MVPSLVVLKMGRQIMFYISNWSLLKKFRLFTLISLLASGIQIAKADDSELQNTCSLSSEAFDSVMADPSIHVRIKESSEGYSLTFSSGDSASRELIRKMFLDIMKMKTLYQLQDSHGAYGLSEVWAH